MGIDLAMEWRCQRRSGEKWQRGVNEAKSMEEIKRK
jgi:hypothetical protein